jgi:hypothetical protein
VKISDHQWDELDGKIAKVLDIVLCPSGLKSVMGYEVLYMSGVNFINKAGRSYLGVIFPSQYSHGNTRKTKAPADDRPLHAHYTHSASCPPALEAISSFTMGRDKLAIIRHTYVSSTEMYLEALF